MSRSSLHYGWPIAEGSDARRDFPAVVDGPRTDAIDAELAGVADDLAAVTAKTNRLGVYASASATVTDMAPGTTLVSLGSLQQAGGFTLDNGGFIVPHTGVYIITMTARFTASGTHQYVGEDTAKNANMIVGGGATIRSTLTWQYLLTRSAGQQVPRPVVYSAPDTWSADVWSTCVYLGQAV
jgi:hypothetical protein